MEFRGVVDAVRYTATTAAISLYTSREVIVGARLCCFATEIAKRVIKTFVSSFRHLLPIELDTN